MQRIDTAAGQGQCCLGTGDVQATLEWDGNSNLDLEVSHLGCVVNPQYPYGNAQCASSLLPTGKLYPIMGASRDQLSRLGWLCVRPRAPGGVWGGLVTNTHGLLFDHDHGIRLPGRMLATVYEQFSDMH